MSQKVPPAIFYFHGGGFIFGLANDLPDALVEEIISSGYQLFCFEYPLAPELALKEIVDFTNYAVRTMSQKLRSLRVAHIVCMGRSAGAYLAAAAVSHVPAEFSRGLFLLYGLYGQDMRTLSERLDVGCDLYLTKKRIQRKIQEHPLCSTRPEERFELYLYARTEGSWEELLQVDTTELSSMIDFSAVRAIPSYLVATSFDPQIPIEESRRFAAKQEVKKLIELELAAHDFEREHLLLAKNVYKDALIWLHNKISHI